MSRVIKLHNAYVLSMPPLCVACGADASGVHQLPVQGGDWTGKRSVKLSFPLCSECYGVLVDGGFHPEKAQPFARKRHIPEELRPRYREIVKSVGVTPGILGGEYQVRFANDVFADRFEDVNENKLTWFERRRRHRAVPH